MEFRRFNSLQESLTALTEGTPSNQYNMSVSNVVASISQYGAYVQFSDFLVVTAIDNYIAETAEVLGEQAGSSIDIITRNIITAGTNVVYAPAGTTIAASRGSITASSVMTGAVCRKLLRQLQRANARPFRELNGNYALVIHPDALYDLLGDSNITTAFQRGAPRGFDDQPELIGYIGQYIPDQEIRSVA